MQHLRFRDDSNSGNRLAILVAEQSPSGQPDAGDVRFALRLRFGHGRDHLYLAKTYAWVRRDVLRTFIEQLLLLERRREGMAKLTSMSPGELEMVIEIIDRAG